MTMTLAEKAKKAIDTECPNLYSITAGHGQRQVVVGDVEITKSVHFPVGILLQERKDVSGRVVHASYEYADGSVLTYTPKGVFCEQRTTY